MNLMSVKHKTQQEYYLKLTKAVLITLIDVLMSLTSL